MTMPRIYLAGPMVFYEDPEAVFDEMKTICARYRLDGVAPLDNQIDVEGDAPGKALNVKIAAADFEAMHNVEGGIFCLDPLRRSPEMDVGTAVEIGYMKALGLPMAGWTSDPRSYHAKVRDYFGQMFGQSLTQTAPNAVGGTSGLTRDPDGMLVHSEGMLQNLMAHGGIELAGGEVHADASWQTAFENAARSLAAQLAPASAYSG